MGQQGSGDLAFTLGGVSIQFGTGEDNHHDLSLSSSISSASTSIIPASSSLVLEPKSFTPSSEARTIATTTLQTIVTATATVFVKETGSLPASVNGASEHESTRESSDDGDMNADRTVLKISIALGTVIGVVLLGLFLIGFMKFTRWRRGRHAATKEDEASLIPGSRKAAMQGQRKWWRLPLKTPKDAEKTPPQAPAPVKKRSASSIMNELMTAAYVAEGGMYSPPPRESQTGPPQGGPSRHESHGSFASWVWRNRNGTSLKSSRTSRKSAWSTPSRQSLSRDTSFRNTKNLPAPPPAALRGDKHQDARSSVWTKDTRDITVWARSSVLDANEHATTEVSREQKPEPYRTSERGALQTRVSAWSSSDTGSRITEGSLYSEW